MINTFDFSNDFRYEWDNPKQPCKNTFWFTFYGKHFYEIIITLFIIIYFIYLFI